MSAKASKAKLHLPSLSVRGFRGIENLSISRLGRVTLFAGKNGVGKTTLLDAVRLYAARGRYSVLTSILQSREELAEGVDEDGEETLTPDWEALFHGWKTSSNAHISIGAVNKNQLLSIKTTSLSSAKETNRWKRLFSSYSSEDDGQLLSIEFQGMKQEIPLLLLASRADVRYRRYFSEESDLPPEIRCESLGPSLLSNWDMARFWDKVALTDDEIRAVDALNLIFGSKVDRVAMIGAERSRRAPYGRRVVAKIEGQVHPVPLKSLGDGAVRLFGVALALANSPDGFLVIDEAENGIHHSVQRDFWKMVIKTAHENNVQVFATTHGWDCVAGFAQAVTESEEVEGALVRLETNGDGIRSVEYSEEELRVVAEQGIEVR
ncbi:MAG: AAA family ATPase [Nitrospira sp.]|nr:AAA family ATPase [Nitrospira sp.]